MTPSDLIGSARNTAPHVYAIGKHRIDRDLAGLDEHLGLMFYGPPGTGKTTLALMLAEYWAGGSKFCVEHLNGQQLTVERVSLWTRDLHYRPLGGRAMVRVVDEFDSGSGAAIGQLRTWLDVARNENIRWQCIIVTTNNPFTAIDPTMNTRFYDREVGRPTNKDILSFLAGRGVPQPIAQQIVSASNGNVRQALIELRKYEDELAVRKLAA